MSSEHLFRRTPVFAAALVLVVAAAAGLEAQDRPNDEPSSFDTLFDRSDLGNTSQGAMMSFHAGRRDIERARKLEEKAAASDSEEQRAKLTKKAEAAYASAASSLGEAIRTNPKLLEAYLELGRLYLHQARHREALQVHAAALAVDPEDLHNLEGHAEALLALDQLAGAASAYERLRAADGELAERLMGAMKLWVEEHRADPGAVNPEAVAALESWIAQQEG